MHCIKIFTKLNFMLSKQSKYSETLLYRQFGILNELYNFQIMRKTGQRFNSTELKKAVTVIKCFICNQMFYAQNTFDAHMKSHSNKLSRNQPEEIQRKTMESFRVKKNVQSRGTSAIIKESANKTVKVTGKSILKENKAENHEPSIESLSNEQSALRESMLLIEKIEKLTKEVPEIEKPHKQETFLTEMQQKEEKKIVKTEEEIAALVLQGKHVSLQIAENCNFSNPFLKNYQQQLLYLAELGHIEEQVCRQKVIKMQEKIVISMRKEIKQFYGSQENNNKSRVELDDNKSEQVENITVNYCGECYLDIQYGEQCWEMDCGHRYHQECWEEGRKCCE